MDVLLVNVSLLMMVMIGHSESLANPGSTVCEDHFIDSKGHAIDIQKDCKDKLCVPKCCGEKEVIFFNGRDYVCKNIAAPTNKDEILPNLSIVSSTNENDIKSAPKSSSRLIYNSKFKNPSCTQGESNVVKTFSIFKNSSLAGYHTREGEISAHADIQNYCVNVLENNVANKIEYLIKLIKTTENNCTDSFKDLNDEKISIEDYCKGRHCIAKCCRKSDTVFYKKKTKCTQISEINKQHNTTVKINFDKIAIYQRNYEETATKTKLNLKKHFQWVINEKLSTPSCYSVQRYWKYVLLENGSLVIEKPNYYNRFVMILNMNDFCFEHLVKVTKDGIQEPQLIFRLHLPPQPDDENEDEETNTDTSERLKAVAMLVSLFFLLLVLFVYGAIKEIQNIAGMILMAYISTLGAMFLVKAVQLLLLTNKKINSNQCKRLSVFLYFLILSSFFWMKVMSLDIWWTFRGMRKCRRIHRRGELNKFYRYALYAWGTPALVAIVVGVIDFMDLTHLPHIFQPHFEHCFNTKGSQAEMRYYLFMPVLALIILNWLFFLMTAFNIWRIGRCFNKFANEESNYNKNQRRFWLYIRLSLVMGVVWVFDTIENLPTWVENIAIAYNLLIGIPIFFIYVFKRNIFIKLCDRFSIQNSFVDRVRRKNSRISNVTHDRPRTNSATFELSEATVQDVDVKENPNFNK